MQFNKGIIGIVNKSKKIRNIYIKNLIMLNEILLSVLTALYTYKVNAVA